MHKYCACLVLIVKKAKTRRETCGGNLLFQGRLHHEIAHGGAVQHREYGRT